MENEQLMPGEFDYPSDVMFTPSEVIRAGDGVALYKLGSDSTLNVKFYDRRVPVKAKSLDGIINWENKIYIKIERPGDRSTVWDRPAKDKDKIRFAHQWQYFLKQGKVKSQGKPVEMLFERGLITQEQLEMLKMSSINTIQQLAASSMGVIEGFGSDGRDLQRIAKGFLNLEIQLAGSVNVEKVKEDLEAQKKLMIEQNEALAAAKKEIEELRAQTLKELEGMKALNKKKGQRKTTEEKTENHKPEDLPW